MKRLKQYLEAGVVIFGAVVYSIACGQLPFTAEETALIGIADDGAMRTLEVENPDDSVFLHTKSRCLQHFQAKSAELDVLMQRMLATVADPEAGGVGLAAPQVGIPYRLIAVQRVDLEGSPWRFYINPEIKKYSSETAVGNEGCFSVATRRGTVRRSTSVVVRYNDAETLKPRTETIEGFAAVIFQHEIDHLDGVLFTDRAEEITPIDQ